jgi:polyisoprenoid-binding protein YceI
MRRHASTALTAAVVLGSLMLAGPSQAELVKYDLDTEHTAITFKVRHFFSKVPGRFGKFSGTLMIDEENFANSSVKVEIEAASIDTNEEARDRHLRSDAFFDVENHPTITFESTRIRLRGDTKLFIDGNLTIRGITKPVTLEGEILGFGEMYSVRRGAFEASVTIDRKDFNVSWNDVLEGGGAVLGNDVEITLNLEAKKAKS